MKHPETVSAYLFDFDGTLVNSMPYWADAMLQILDQSGVDYPENIIQIITPMGLHNTCVYLHEQFGIGTDGDDVMRMVEEFATPLYENEIPAKEFVKEKLLGLKEEGKILCVLTASPHKWVDPCLKRNGLYDLFREVWTYEDFSTPKTDPATYTEAAARLGLAVTDAAFLDDNINACRGAAESGIVTIGVYDETSKDDRPLFDEVCRRYINTFEEL